MDRAGIEALFVAADPTRLRVLAALLETEADGVSVATVADRTGIEPRRVERALRQIDDAQRHQPGHSSIAVGLQHAFERAVQDRPLERALEPGSRLRGLVRRGVLVQVPTNQSLLVELAETLARALEPLESLQEADLNRVLADLGDDDALVRRLLVDEGWLSREPSTQVYRPTDRTRELWTSASTTRQSAGTPRQSTGTRQSAGTRTAHP